MAPAAGRGLRVGRAARSLPYGGLAWSSPGIGKHQQVRKLRWLQSVKLFLRHIDVPPGGEADGRNPHRLTNHSADDREPAWGRRGSRPLPGMEREKGIPFAGVGAVVTAPPTVAPRSRQARGSGFSPDSSCRGLDGLDDGMDPVAAKPRTDGDLRGRVSGEPEVQDGPLGGA